MSTTLTERKSPPSDRIQEIDYLRAYAVSAVVILHLCLIVYPAVQIKSYVHFDYGVDLFFVISGFVVSEALEKLRLKGLKGHRLYVSFLMRRLNRLWMASAYWLIFCLALSVIFVDLGVWPPIFQVCGMVLSGFGYVYNLWHWDAAYRLGYFWTLSLEWQFYLLLPLLMMLPRAVANGALALLFISTFFWMPGGDFWWMFRYEGIIVGIVIWEIRKNGYFDVVEDFLLRWRSAQFLTFLILLFSTMWFSFSRYDAKVDVCRACLFGGGLVAMASCNKGYISVLGLNGILNWIGLRSYSIYLCHIPVILTFLVVLQKMRLAVAPVVFVPVVLLSVLGVAHLSFKYLEPQKIGKLLAFLSRPLTGKPSLLAQIFHQRTGHGQGDPS